MASPAHRKAARHAVRKASGKPDEALAALVRGLAQDLAEQDYKAQGFQEKSGSARLEDSAQNSPEKRS